ncbi:uncharacterized protein [Musca autumnalis]|uniref:uncharacterized protein n=1 Tax=Musca autumnalis TaxID=221902 RepID=UPI003CF57D0C
MPPNNEIVNPNENLQIPAWINADYFRDLIAKDVPDMVDIKKFTPTAATPPGENFTSIMLRLHFDLEMKDGTTKYKTYIFKTMLEDDKGGELINKLSLFPKEMEMYGKYLPAFEQLYKAVGWNIQISPKCLYTEKKDNRINLLFEDLKERNFQNPKRIEGCDMDHMKAVLTKLAEFHAASAVYEEQHGAYPEDFQYGFVDSRQGQGFLKMMYETNVETYKEAMAQWELDDVETYIKKFPTFDQYWKSALCTLEQSSNNFNVLTHGDFWSSNIMFNYFDNGKLNETLMVDFQICKWGSPAEDLLFFITLSAAGDIRIKEYDHFVAMYHQRLIECLKVLGYKKPLPTLRSLHQDMFNKNNSFYAFFACMNHLPIVMLPSDKDSNIHNFSRQDEIGRKLRLKAYTNPLFVKAIKDIFPFYHQRGIFNFEDYEQNFSIKFSVSANTCCLPSHQKLKRPKKKMPPNNEIINPNENLQIPAWINADYFRDLIAKDVPDMVDIKKFTPTAATPPGENFTSIMLRLHFDLEMKDGTTKYKTYIFKTMLDDDKGGELINKLSLFPKEMEMYGKYLPAFEELYKAVGWNIQISPKCLYTEKKENRINLLFEDLKERNFQNPKRIEGCDMDHMKAVLTKLAEFHAASAVYEEQHGAYPEDFQYGFVDSRQGPAFLRTMFESSVETYKEAMAQWGIDNIETYIKKFPTFDQYWKSALSTLQQSSNNFNVLTHGDFWSSNIMFNYFDNGKHNETLMVDFQICKWGSPAEDLLFFITLSAAADIRIKEYDHFVAMYHQRLIECLKVLGYKKPLPTLRSLQQDMFNINNSFYAFFACLNHLPVIMFPSDKDSNIHNFSSQDEIGRKLRLKAYTNPLFVKAIKDIFPFYHQRGIFNFEDYEKN